MTQFVRRSVEQEYICVWLDLRRLLHYAHGLHIAPKSVIDTERLKASQSKVNAECSGTWKVHKATSVSDQKGRSTLSNENHK